MKATEFAKFVAEMIFEEKETVLEAIENDDIEMLRDEI